MSSLPGKVKKPHFAAIRNYKNIREDKEINKERIDDPNIYNAHVEPLFVKWLEKVCPMTYLKAINNAAYIFNCSTATTKRWINKYCCDYGPFNIIDGMIVERENKNE